MCVLVFLCTLQASHVETTTCVHKVEMVQRGWLKKDQPGYNLLKQKSFYLHERCPSSIPSLSIEPRLGIYLQIQKLLTFFSAKILAYVPYLMIKVLTIC